MSIVETDGETLIKIAGYTLIVDNGGWTMESPEGPEISVSTESVPDYAKWYIQDVITDYKLNKTLRYPQRLAEEMVTIWYMIDVVSEAELRDMHDDERLVAPYDPSEDYVKLKGPQEIWRERRNQIAKGNKQIYDYLID